MTLFLIKILSEFKKKKAFGFLALISLGLSFCWSLFSLYEIRKKKIQVLGKIKSKEHSQNDVESKVHVHIISV